MQNLSQPIWMRTYAWNGVGRIVGSRSGSKLSWLRSTSSRLPSLRPRLTSICGPAPAAIFSISSGTWCKLAGADDQIDVRRPLEDELLILLGHAADDADDLVRVAAAWRSSAGPGRCRSSPRHARGRCRC